MLPLRLELEGFLTYRQKTILDFRGHWLWAITGPNGAGKSAIFDAITFVLFGEHRGGRQHEELLVSQGTDYTRVAFDFAVVGSSYRVERTLARRRGRRGQPTGWEKTCQVYVLPSGDFELAGGQPLANTNSVDGLEKSVRDTIGLTSKTFASSVLLRQGEADKFVISTPAERKGVLMDVLDLAPYVRLEAAARRHASVWKERAEESGRELQALAHATLEAVRQANENRVATEAAVAGAERNMRSADQTLTNARSFADVISKIDSARRRLREVDAILADAPAIEAAQQELAELDNVLPKLRAIVQLRQAATEARSREAASRAKTAGVDVEGTREVQLRTASAAAQAGHEYDDARITLAGVRSEEERLRPLAEAAATVKRLNEEASDAETKVAALELEAAELMQPREHLRDCNEADRAIASLRALAEDRGEAATEESQRRQIMDRLPDLKLVAEQMIAAAQSAKEISEAAASVTRETEIALAGKRRDLTSTNGELTNRREAGKEGTCSRCGQKVNETHIHREIADCEERQSALVREIAELEERLNRDAEEAQRCEGVLQQKIARRSAADAALTEATRKAQAHEERRAHATTRVAQDLAALSKSYRILASEPSYPNESTLAQVSALSKGQAEADRICGTLEKKADRAVVLRDQAQQTRLLAQQTSDRFPGLDLEVAQSDHDLAREQAKSLEKVEKGAFARWQAAQTAATDATRRFGDTQSEYNRLVEEANKEQAAAASHESAAEALQAQITPTWQERAKEINTRSLLEVEARRGSVVFVAARNEVLASARQERLRAEGELTVLEEALRAIPEVDRITVQGAQERVQEAQAAVVKANASRDIAIQAEIRLTSESTRRSKLETKYLQGERLAHDYGILTKYLGKDHLQAWLVQEAQEVIGQAANVYLAAISDGLLRIALKPKGDDLEILVSDLSSGEEPMEVKFVSGSQRFRVAVALALAIGQYSGGASRQIKSVIIDEGFGTLDTEGRRQMIEQLKALEGTLDCVILVSHHEDFQEAFTNGYHIEKANGTSRVILRHDILAHAKDD